MGVFWRRLVQRFAWIELIFFGQTREWSAAMQKRYMKSIWWRSVAGERRPSRAWFKGRVPFLHYMWPSFSPMLLANPIKKTLQFLKLFPAPFDWLYWKVEGAYRKIYTRSNLSNVKDPFVSHFDLVLIEWDSCIAGLYRTGRYSGAYNGKIASIGHFDSGQSSEIHWLHRPSYSPRRDRHTSPFSWPRRGPQGNTRNRNESCRGRRGDSYLWHAKH